MSGTSHFEDKLIPDWQGNKMTHAFCKRVYTYHIAPEYQYTTTVCSHCHLYFEKLFFAIKKTGYETTVRVYAALGTKLKGQGEDSVNGANYTHEHYELY